jgi:hypothetical protein
MKPEVEPGRLINRKALRELLVKSFDYEDLKDLCFDHYPAVYEKLGNGFGKNVVARSLIDHCERHGLIDDLVSQVKAQNPFQYSAYEDRLFSRAAAPATAADQARVTVKLVFPDIKLEDLTPDKQAALIHIMAEELDIPEDSITIVEIRQGSTIVVLSLPILAVRRLLALLFAGHALIKDLGLSRVEGAPLSLSLAARVAHLLTSLSKFFNLSTFLVGTMLTGGLVAALLTAMVSQNSAISSTGESPLLVPNIVFVTPTDAPAVQPPEPDPVPVVPITTLTLQPTSFGPTTTATSRVPTQTVAITSTPVSTSPLPTYTPGPTLPSQVTTPAQTPTLIPEPTSTAAPTHTSTPVPTTIFPTGLTPTPTPTKDTTTLGSTPTPVSAVVIVDGPQQVEAAQLFTVTVKIDVLESPGVFGAQFELDYEPTYLEIVEVQAQPELLVALKAFDNELGQLRFAASRREDVANFTDEVTFATVMFQVRPTTAEIVTSLNLQNVKLGAKGGISVPAAAQNLDLTIKRDVTE